MATGGLVAIFASGGDNAQTDGCRSFGIARLIQLDRDGILAHDERSRDMPAGTVRTFVDLCPSGLQSHLAGFRFGRVELLPSAGIGFTNARMGAIFVGHH